MNILVFSWRDPKHPLAGGAEQVMHEHMKGWVGAEHTVTLFTSQYKGCRKEEILDGVRIIRSGKQYLDVQIKGCIWYLFGNHGKFDLVVDQFHGIPFFTPFYVRVKKLAVIQEAAKNVWFLNPLPKPLNWIVGILGYIGEPILFLPYRNVTFMTGSESAKVDVAKFGIPKDNIKVIPHGVIIKPPATNLKKESAVTIIYLGIISKDKGIEDALETFSTLDLKGEFRFWVVGRFETKSYEKVIKKKVKGLNLEGKIKFWGFVSQEKKFELLAKAHFLVNPSIREGWGLVNIEANAVGTPVIAYKVVGLIDSVKDNQSGVILNQNSSKEMTNQIISIINNKKLYQKLVKGAKIWASQFSWVQSRKKSLDLIEEISESSAN